MTDINPNIMPKKLAVDEPVVMKDDAVAKDIIKELTFVIDEFDESDFLASLKLFVAIRQRDVPRLKQWFNANFKARGFVTFFKEDGQLFLKLKVDKDFADPNEEN
jgi:hypothetical protein